MTVPFYTQYERYDAVVEASAIGEQWRLEQTFRNILKAREGSPEYVFYDGPPSANGKPGIHHVLARAIKDCFCRYHTQLGQHVERKAGWDTHGLPVELGVEKMLHITKEDIGRTVSVKQYNDACRAEVMKYIDLWRQLTEQMGYWIDMDAPYITYDNKYIESVWHLLKDLYDKGLLYKGYTIQPYSPAAGTGLSSHELNQPGCYRDVRETTVTAQFHVLPDQQLLGQAVGPDLHILAWTTTPWTLPSNTALCVGPSIEYSIIRTFNPYTGQPERVVLATELVGSYFGAPGETAALSYTPGDKVLPWRSEATCLGGDLVGLRYEQLIPWARPDGDAFRVIPGDYVSTDDGTGIVHIAPDFGADDARVAKAAGIAALMFVDKAGKPVPMVDRRGRLYDPALLDDSYRQQFLNAERYAPWAGRPVKNAYDDQLAPDAPTLDIDLCLALKADGRAFRIAKHTHSYPHCWRTDKPILYYPLDSWFVRTTAVKDELIALNNTIGWHPSHTGSGRFGNWLENLQDWNLSRSRFWGTPLPIWRTADGREEKCIGSLAELMAEIDRSVAAGLMDKNPYADFRPGDYSADNYSTEHLDLHRPYIDAIVLCSPSGQPMRREADLIDVWFDSGAMPFAQYHWPFEHASDLLFPADFIAEGVDQTRGWFFTLHAIATMTQHSVAFRNVVSNGLVLDAQGNKMSKRLGNAVDPFEALQQYGPDAVRWYMLTNSLPWDNLKFDLNGVQEVSRKFFGTLHNTYSFFALYANVDGYQGGGLPEEGLTEADRWILSELNTLVRAVGNSLDDYDPTTAGRLVEGFVEDNLSNWYVRLNRRRFWRGPLDADKQAAYGTLETCLSTVAQLIAPIAPFMAERLWRDLGCAGSVHQALWPAVDELRIDQQLEQRMRLAQQCTSLLLQLRRQAAIKVRQPLAKALVPSLGADDQQLLRVKDLIMAEVNIKSLDIVTSQDTLIHRQLKPNYKTLGKRCGPLMKSVAAALAAATPAQIAAYEQSGSLTLEVSGQAITLQAGDAEVVSTDVPGWLVASDGRLTVALDIEVSPELKLEGLARELVNRIQNMRKEAGLQLTDRIRVQLTDHPTLRNVVNTHGAYIGEQTLADELLLVPGLEQGTLADIDEKLNIHINIGIRD